MLASNQTKREGRDLGSPSSSRAIARRRAERQYPKGKQTRRTISMSLEMSWRARYVTNRGSSVCSRVLDSSMVSLCLRLSNRLKEHQANLIVHGGICVWSALVLS